MKILVRGAYGESNFGDDALMAVLEQFFVQNGLGPDVTFTSFVNADYCLELVKRTRYVNFVDVKMSEVDLMVYGGGTQFFAFKKKESRLVRVIEKIKKLEFSYLAKKLLKVATDNEFSVKKAAIGIGIGPFKIQDEQLEGYKKLAREFDYIAVRDEVSYDYCKNWGLQNATLRADICFSDYLDLSEIKPLNQKRAKKRIGVIVRDWIQDAEGVMYYTPLMNVVESHGDKYEFVYIVFAPDMDPQWMKKLAAVEQEVVVWNPESDTIPAFTQLMAEFDGFITARYHGAVFASLLGKPTICVEIEPKLKILTDQVPEFKLWNKPFAEEQLVESLSYFDNDGFDCSGSVGILRERANEMFSDFLSFIQYADTAVAESVAVSR